MTYLTIPTVCPRCGKPTKIKQNTTKSFTKVIASTSTKVLMCTNKNCGAKIEGKLQHFIDSHGLDIESMSTAIINDLIDLGWLTKMSDIFHLKEHRDEWIQMKGYGENSVDKILEGIPTSIELWKVIASAGIPSVEKQTAILLADHYQTWEAFRQAIDNKEDLTKLNGIGDITAKVILEFDYSEIDDVMNYLTIKQKVVGGVLDHMSFCITGSLIHYSNRDELVKVIESNGGKIAGVNKNLTYLICNDKTSTSGKSKKAKDLGIPVITEEEFMNMIV